MCVEHTSPYIYFILLWLKDKCNLVKDHFSGLHLQKTYLDFFSIETVPAVFFQMEKKASTA